MDVVFRITTTNYIFALFSHISWCEKEIIFAVWYLFSTMLTSSIFDFWCSRFGTWPVAMLAPSKNKAILEGPVCNGSRVIGWHTNEKSKRLRRFHVDMSGFAFNSTILWDPKRWHCPFSNPIRQLDTVKEGFQVCIKFCAFYGCFSVIPHWMCRMLMFVMQSYDLYAGIMFLCRKLHL